MQQSYFIRLTWPPGITNACPDPEPFTAESTLEAIRMAQAIWYSHEFVEQPLGFNLFDEIETPIFQFLAGNGKKLETPNGP